MSDIGIAFKKKLLRGEKLIGFEIDLCDPCISEMVGLLGYDYLWIDTEHEAMDYQTVLQQIISAHSAGVASVVRVPFNEPYLAKRILEMGPDGIIFPQVSSAEELKKAMDACMYPPIGTRGFGPRRACRYGIQDLFEYIEQAPDSFCRFVQIEHVDGIRNLHEMTKNPYVDGFILGPCDLSGSISRLNDIFCPECVDLYRRFVEECQKANKAPGVAIGATDEDSLRFWKDLGIQFISAGSDIATIVSGATEQQKRMASIIKK